MTQIAAVVLAAGESTRFGSCKQLLDWYGKPLLTHVTDVALSAGCRPVVAVLGCQAPETLVAIGDRPVRKLMNWRWEEGLGTSVQTGLAGVPPEVEAALFLQGDQPLVTAELLQAMVDRFEESGASIIYPTHAGKRGTPVLFARRLFSELSRIEGDEGGRRLIDRYPEEAETIEVSNPDVLMDVDTPQDYQRLRSGHGRNDVESLGRGIEPLEPIRHVILDMDGVLWRGDKAMPGLTDLFSFLEEQNIGYTLATNNSSRTPDQYVTKLGRFGVEVPTETILTSAMVCAAAVAESAHTGSRVYVIGKEGIRQALLERGLVLADDNADYVVVGWDRDLTWQKLADASLLIQDGAGFFGTNPDVTFPSERGTVPGTGALLAALEVATGVKPRVTGKPALRMYEEALHRMDATPATTAMVGDRLDTDIAGASRAGLTTVLVLSGIATEGDVKAARFRPDAVFADIRELLSSWKRVAS